MINHSRILKDRLNRSRILKERLNLLISRYTISVLCPFQFTKPQQLIMSSSDSYSSESDIRDYSEKPYKKLQSGEINIGKGRKMRCPFCVGKKIKLYESRQLLQHAEGISNSSKRRSKVRGDHHALARYLKDTVPGDHVRVPGESSEPLMCYPWTGILAVKGLDKEGRLTKQYLTDILKRFKPIDIVLLKNKADLTGEAIIKFQEDYDGYYRLLQFDTFYAREQHGKKDYAEENNKGFNIYGWLASADDYDSSGVVGDYLRSTVQLKRFSDVVNEKEADMKGRINELIEKVNDRDEEVMLDM